MSQIASISVKQDAVALEMLPDGAKVDEILFRYQVEWQLWSAVVNHFEDPNYHMAYLSLVSRSLLFSEAVKRYQQHSKIMARLEDSQWQSEICDRQLDLLRTLSIMQFERELQSTKLSFRLPRSLSLILAFTFGVFLAVHFGAR